MEGMTMVQATEKRRHERFKTRERCLVLLADGLHPYHLVDISDGGFAFRYLGREPRQGSSSRASLFFDTELCVQDIPVEFVADLQIQEGAVPYRRCGIRFGNLSVAQQRQLDSYIDQHTWQEH